MTRFLFAALLSLTALQPAHALDLKPYSDQALAQAQKAGQPVALHFHAEWCPICKAQQKHLQGWKDDAALNYTVLVADFDTEAALKQRLGVKTQSTLIVYRGAQERARVVGGTAAAPLREALLSATH
jgi:thioredoxin 1